MKKLFVVVALLLSTQVFAATAEIGLIAAANLSKGVDWEKNNYQTPYIQLEQKFGQFYIGAYDSVRLNLDNSNTDHHLDLWKINSGYRFANGVVAEVGHEHKHDMGIKNKRPEAFDYVAIKYKFEF